MLRGRHSSSSYNIIPPDMAIFQCSMQSKSNLIGHIQSADVGISTPFLTLKDVAFRYGIIFFSTEAQSCTTCGESNFPNSGMFSAT